MTSFGNSMINIIVTHTVYRNLGLDAFVELVLVLGDDNLTIFRKDEEMTPEQMAALNQKLQEGFADYGFQAKYKLSDHIAKAEYCNHWFVPCIDKDGKDTFTCIRKAGKLLLSFNKVRKSALEGITLSAKAKAVD